MRSRAGVPGQDPARSSYPDAMCPAERPSRGFRPTSGGELNPRRACADHGSMTGSQAGKVRQMFEPSAEAMPAEELASLQESRLRALVGRLLGTDGVQAQRLRAAGVTAPDDVALADLPRLPMVAKADLWAAYPYGMLEVPPADLVTVHGSSGTGGRPTLVGYTRADLALWARMCAR